MPLLNGENLLRVEGIAGNFLQSPTKATMKAHVQSPCVFFDDIKQGRCRNDCCRSVTSR